MKNRKIDKMKEAYSIVSMVDNKIIPTCLIFAILTSLEPYIDTIMITLILDGFINEKRIEIIFMILIIMIIFKIVIKFLIVFFSHKKEYRMFISSHTYKKMKTKKFMNVKFEQLETSDFEDIRQGVRYSDENMGTFNNLVNVFQDIFRVIFSIMAALIILSSLFVKVFSEQGSNNIYTILAIILFIIIVYVLTKISIQQQKKSEIALPELYNKINTSNRLSMNLANTAIFDYSAGKDIRINSMEKIVVAEMDKNQKKVEPLLKGIGKHTSLPGAIGSASSAIIGGVVYSLVSLYVVAGYISISNILLYANSVQNLIGCITSLVFLFGNIGVLLIRLEPTLKLLEMPEESDETSKESIHLGDYYEVIFDDVSFKYPQSDVWALKNVTFKLSTEETTAIVGSNGAGKTTVVKLLSRLYKPTKGRILLNGIDIEEISIENYRPLLGVLFQDFKLFSFSIGQNISVSETYNSEKAEKVLVEAGFLHRLETLPLKLETPLYNDFDSNGVEISGGEAQKIAIARMLYRDSSIVILDEPTSALDPISEAEIYEGFNSIIENKLAIFVSHRLSACKFCDNILVFSDGKIIENGNHDSLLKNKEGTYYQLWEAQAQYYR